MSNDEVDSENVAAMHPSQRHLLPVFLPLLLRGSYPVTRDGRRRQRVVRVGVEVRRERRDEALAVAEARLQLQVLLGRGTR